MLQNILVQHNASLDYILRSSGVYLVGL